MKILFSTLTILLSLVAAAPATAKPAGELMHNVPGTSPVIVGMEMSKIKSTRLFNEAMSFLKKAAKDGTVLQFVLSKKPFDIEKDITTAVVALSSAPTNPQQPPPPAMAVIDGSFDAKRVKAAVQEKYGKLKSRKLGKLTIYSTAGVDFAFVDARTLVIAERGYADATWKAASDPKHAAAANKDIMALFDLTDTSRGIWFTMNTKAVPNPSGAPAMDGAGISVDLRQGLALDFNSKFAKSDDATKAKEQFEALKKSSGDDAMLDMFGAKPLVQNMVATVQKERILNMSTAITDAEVDVMIKRIKAMNEQPPPVAPSGQQGGPTTQPTRQTGTGTKADFN